MQTVALTAHYNGQHILLDEPFQLEPGTPLLITVLPRPQPEADWYHAAAQNLAAAYGDDEPDYGPDDIKEKTPNMQAGSVVLVALPQADGQVKNRPAIILCEMPPFRDVLLCGISSQVHQAAANFNDLLQPADTDFASSGLRAASVIRLGFLTVLPRSRVSGAIGFIASSRHQQLLNRLATYLQASTQAGKTS